MRIGQNCKYTERFASSLALLSQRPVKLALIALVSGDLPLRISSRRI